MTMRSLRLLLPVLAVPFVAPGVPAYAESTAEDVLRRAEVRLAANPAEYAALQNRGWALYELGRHAEAGAAFERAYAAAPDDAGRAAARYNLGNALFRQQKTKEALEQYRLGLRLAPGDEDLIYNFTVAKRLERQDQKKKDDKQDGKDKQDRKPDGGQGDKERQTQPAAKPGTMSREEALRILGQLEEQSRRNQPQGQPNLRRLKKEKDW